MYAGGNTRWQAAKRLNFYIFLRLRVFWGLFAQCSMHFDGFDPEHGHPNIPRCKIEVETGLGCRWKPNTCTTWLPKRSFSYTYCIFPSHPSDLEGGLKEMKKIAFIYFTVEKPLNPIFSIGEPVFPRSRGPKTDREWQLALKRGQKEWRSLGFFYG